MMGHQLHSHLDLFLLSSADKVQCNQSLQKQTHDYHPRDRQLQIDDLVLYSKEPWSRCTLDSWQDTETVTFLVKLTDGIIICHNLDQLKLNLKVNSDVSIPDHFPSSEVATPELKHSCCIRYPP